MRPPGANGLSANWRACSANAPVPPVPPAPPLPPQPPPAIPSPGAGPLAVDAELPLQDRVTLLDTGGAYVAGRLPGAQPDARRAILSGGQAIGYLAVNKARPPSDALASAFLQQLKDNVLLIAAASIALSALAAVLLAAHFRRPIERLNDGARLLTEGRFDTRLPDARSDELGELARSVNRLAETLGAAEASRRQWVADTSHELRTPLSVLRAQLEAIQDGVRPADAGGTAAMLRQVMSLNTLIDQLYSLARADVGELECRKAPLDLGHWHANRPAASATSSMPPAWCWKPARRPPRRGYRPIPNACGRCSPTCSKTASAIRSRAGASRCTRARMAHRWPSASTTARRRCPTQRWKSWASASTGSMLRAAARWAAPASDWRCAAASPRRTAAGSNSRTRRWAACARASPCRWNSHERACSSSRTNRNWRRCRTSTRSIPACAGKSAGTTITYVIGKGETMTGSCASEGVKMLFILRSYALED